MSFGGGKNKNNSKSSSQYSGTSDTNTNYNTTTTPTNADWVTNGASGLWSTAQGLGAENPQSYVAGPNLLQLQAGTGAGALTGSPDLYHTAEGITSNAFGRPAAQSAAVTANGYVDNYLNPYLKNVVDASMADFDANAGQTRAQQQLDLTKSHALGGSGSALTIGQTEGQLARARATTDSGLRTQAYDTALTNAQQDAARAQTANDLNAQLKMNNRQMILGAAGQLGALAGQQGETQRQNIAAQDAAGGVLQGISQQQAQAPLDLQAWLGQYFSGLPTNLFHGQTEVGTQTSKETQSGTQSGKGSNTGYNFGFKAGG